MSQLRVAVIIDRLGLGGAEKLLIEAAKAFPAEHIELTVFNLGDAPNSDVPAELEALGVPVVSVPPRTKRVLLDIGRIGRLATLLRDGHFDVVHTHLAYANTVGILAARRAKLPVVTTLHNANSGVRRGQSIRDRLESFSLRRTSRLIVVGPTAAEAQRERLGPDVPLTVIDNPVPQTDPVDEELRDELRLELLGERKGPLVISVGRLTEQKNFALLLSAFDEFADDHPEAVLALAGRGHLLPDLVAQRATMANGDRVRLLGPRNDVPILMEAGDLFVSSSSWEGLSLVILEAMNHGLPIVATDAGDTAYALGDTGLVVRPNDQAALVAGMRSAVKDSSRAKGATRGPDRVQAMFGPARWAEANRAVYDEVIRRHRRRPPRLSILVHGYYPRIGGIERQRALVTPGIVAAGYDVEVLTRNVAGSPAHEEIDEVQIRRLWAPGYGPAASFTYTVLALARMVRRRPDLVHAHELFSTTRTGLWAKRLFKCKLVVMTHRSGPIGDVGKNKRRWRGRRVLDGVAKNADLVISVSNELDTEISALGIPRERRMVLRNGVDTERYAPVNDRRQAKAELGMPDGFAAVFVGRLMPEKRVDLLLKVWDDVRTVDTNATLLVVGVGDLEEELRAAAGDGVRFVGQTDDVKRYLQAADVFVLPSEAEGLSNAMLEAGACGLPLVVSDVGAASDVVNDNTGVLLPPGDADALRVALTDLAQDAAKAKRLGAAARATVEEHFGVAHTIAELVKAYDRLLARR